MFNKILKKRGFTLVELIIYMILIGIVLYPMAPLLNFSMMQLKEEQDQAKPFFYALIEDIKYDNIYATSISIDSASIDKSIEFTRIDSCVIKYIRYDADNEIKREVSCPAGTFSAIREYTINNIASIDITTNSLNNYEIIIDNSKDSFYYRYIIYNK